MCFLGDLLIQGAALIIAAFYFATKLFGFVHGGTEEQIHGSASVHHTSGGVDDGPYFVHDIAGGDVAHFQPATPDNTGE